MVSIVKEFVLDVTTTFKKMNFREFCMQAINLGGICLSDLYNADYAFLRQRAQLAYRWQSRGKQEPLAE